MRKLHLELHDIFLKIEDCDELLKTGIDNERVLKLRREWQDVYSQKLSEILSIGIKNLFENEDEENFI